MEISSDTCRRCEENRSSVNCTNCNAPFCDRCYNEVHSKGKFMLHIKIAINKGNLNSINESSVQANVKKLIPTSPSVQTAILVWIIKMTGEPENMIELTNPDAPLEILGDGILLCKLVNRIIPRTIISIDESLNITAFKKNLTSYLEGCQKLGLRTELFSENMFDTVPIEFQGLVENLCAVEKAAIRILNLTNPKDFIQFQLEVSPKQSPVLEAPPSNQPSSEPIKVVPKFVPDVSQKKAPPQPPGGGRPLSPSPQRSLSPPPNSRRPNADARPLSPTPASISAQRSISPAPQRAISPGPQRAISPGPQRFPALGSSSSSSSSPTPTRAGLSPSPSTNKVTFDESASIKNITDSTESVGSDKDPSDFVSSAFFSYVYVPSENDSFMLENADNNKGSERESLFKLFEEERKRNELERKKLEERILEEESLINHIVQQQTLKQNSQQNMLKEIHSQELDNLQLKQGVESLQSEITRLHRDKTALQERVKKTFEVLDLENKQLQLTLQGMQNELTGLKKEKKVIIDEITTVTLGNMSAMNNSRSALSAQQTNEINQNLNRS